MNDPFALDLTIILLLLGVGAAMVAGNLAAIIKSKRREGGRVEMQRVVALENDLVAWKAKNRASGKEESKDVTVPKGHCFVASEREDVAHVGVVPIGLIEAKVRCAAFGDDLKIQRMEKKTWEDMVRCIVAKKL